ncbi:hypothetical protein LX77_02174 [Gelidibacter algens]|uniref:Tetratricopeptide repeat protein n=1 Tax=Gelidibacter algens TaxID=49280 RepID=A0A1A7R0S2_9FLAO|nr:hypothetical protein [Gelidibacter algens]OBX25079.1 hypothetical protein A9996_11820 [Gelidibacter algens]RAJ23015.1 hypothetical protein LX77_02174 [Gelidibacter algens]
MKLLNISLQQLIKPLSKFLLFNSVTFFALSANAQFQIVGMQFNGNSADAVNLTIIAPNGTPFTGIVPYDQSKAYNSGTTFKTPASTSIAILYKGQTQVMDPNSVLKVSIVKNGVVAQTLTGRVKHVLKDVKSKLGFYKAGNGYTWAHAEGTEFYVEAFQKSKKAKFTTEEGTIAIMQEVPININEAAKNEKTRGNRGEGRELTTTKKIYSSAGEEYIAGNVQPISYRTYEEALQAFEQEINQKEGQGNFYMEELADDFTLLGELYLDNGQADEAIEPLRKAAYYNSEANPDDLMVLESYLYLAEALIDSSNEENFNEGVNFAQEMIRPLTEVLDEYTEEYNYALELEDYDYAWDLCYELVDINEYLGWSYDLLDQTSQADQYYQASDAYHSHL